MITASGRRDTSSLSSVSKPSGTLFCISSGITMERAASLLARSVSLYLRASVQITRRTSQSGYISKPRCGSRLRLQRMHGSRTFQQLINGRLLQIVTSTGGHGVCGNCSPLITFDKRNDQRLFRFFGFYAIQKLSNSNGIGYTK